MSNSSSCCVTSMVIEYYGRCMKKNSRNCSVEFVQTLYPQQALQHHFTRMVNTRGQVSSRYNPSMHDQPPHPFQTHGFDQYHKGQAGGLFNLPHHTFSQHSCMQLHFHKQGTAMGEGWTQASMLVNIEMATVSICNRLMNGSSTAILIISRSLATS